MKTDQDILVNTMLEDRASVHASKTFDTNCPNCGAPRQGRSCEYCGTVFISDYVANFGDTLIRNQTLTANEMRSILDCKPSEEEEAGLELRRKLQDMLAAIKNAEQQQQIVQSIMPYRFNPMANTSQCCCSIQDSIRRQYDSQQYSILDDMLVRNRILTPNEMRGTIGFKPSDTFF